MREWLMRMEQYPFIDFSLAMVSFLITYLGIIVLAIVITPVIIALVPLMIPWALWRMVREGSWLQ